MSIINYLILIGSALAGLACGVGWHHYRSGWRSSVLFMGALFFSFIASDTLFSGVVPVWLTWTLWFATCIGGAWIEMALVHFRVVRPGAADTKGGARRAETAGTANEA